ncbi:MAG: DUF4340 domain-containing protein [Proteobacteria bacterium]|nr:DUF4340 domain-containing protein [Pseudomonadota bacterium]
MDLNAFLSDPRRRTLAILAGVALVAILLALGALWREAQYSAPPMEPTEFFPGLVKELRGAAHIHVESKAGAFDVVFVPEKGWVVRQRDNYPASFDQIQRTLVGLAALQAIEPKTARPEWLHYVGLDAPPKGDGVAITVSDDKGRVLAALIAGKSEDIGDASGATGLFVRRPNEDQSYLARSVFEPRANISDWLDKKVMDVDQSRIQSVTVQPANGPSYTVSRLLKSDANFTVSPMPAGKTLTDPTVPGGVASAITGFGFDDLKKASDFDFSGATRVTTKTFDGLSVTVNVIKQGADYWATVSAAADDPSKADAAKEAAEINAHANGWAYKLPAFKGQLYMTTLDSLFTPPTAAPPSATP